MSDLSLLSGIYRTSRLLADFRYLRTSAVRRSNLHTTFQRGRISPKNSDGCNFRLLQHGVIPGSSQTKARESALQERMRPTLMWPRNDGERQWNTMSDWTYR